MLARVSGSLLGRSAFLALIGLASSSVLAGPDWVERNDAGSNIFTAQAPLRPVGALRLDSIQGDLASGVLGNDYEDLYFFSVVDPAAFSVTVADADFNAVLYLFDITVNSELFGRLGNDNMEGETLLPRLTNASTDGTGVLISRPGDYVIAVTGAGRVPMSRTGPIFNLASPTEISGPDGLGGINPLDSWAGIGEQGSYRLTFTSADFPAIPAPGASLLAVVGGVVIVRRRRK